MLPIIRKTPIYKCSNCIIARYSTHCLSCDDHYCFQCIKQHEKKFKCTSCGMTKCVAKLDVKLNEYVGFTNLNCYTCICVFKPSQVRKYREYIRENTPEDTTEDTTEDTRENTFVSGEGNEIPDIFNDVNFDIRLQKVTQTA